MTHDLPHAKTCAALPDGMSLAHDGLVLTVDEADDDAALASAAGTIASIR